MKRNAKDAIKRYRIGDGLLTHFGDCPQDTTYHMRMAIAPMVANQWMTEIRPAPEWAAIRILSTHKVIEGTIRRLVALYINEIIYTNFKRIGKRTKKKYLSINRHPLHFRHENAEVLIKINWYVCQWTLYSFMVSSETYWYLYMFVERQSEKFFFVLFLSFARDKHFILFRSFSLFRLFIHLWPPTIKTTTCYKWNIELTSWRWWWRWSCRYPIRRRYHPTAQQCN